MFDNYTARLWGEEEEEGGRGESNSRRSGLLLGIAVGFQVRIQRLHVVCHSTTHRPVLSDQRSVDSYAYCTWHGRPAAVAFREISGASC